MLVSNWDTSTLTLKNYSPSAGASSSSLTRVSISPDFSPVFGVDEEVLHEDFWGGGVRGAVLVVEVFFDVVLLLSPFCRLLY